jgi:alpha-D-ribose 1-methylphosphonate 5-triphosphate synthase subunit PhnH
MTAPAFTTSEARNRETFLALMWTFSYPGRVHPLPEGHDPFEQVAETLLDLETSFYSIDMPLLEKIVRTSARPAPIHQAEYIFFPRLTKGDLDNIACAKVGTMHRPDEAATLILGAEFGTGTRLSLKGPGIKGELSIQVGGIPAPFWTLHQRTRRFPLGWDIYLIDLISGVNLIGIPRSTEVTLLES